MKITEKIISSTLSTVASAKEMPREMNSIVENETVLNEQKKSIAYRHGLEEDHEVEELNQLLIELQKNDTEYLVDGAILTCPNATPYKQLIFYDQSKKEIESEPHSIRANSRLTIHEDRKETVNARPYAHIKDCTGGMRDDTNNDRNVNIVGFGNCRLIPEDFILVDAVGEEKAEKIKKMLEAHMGTCYCFMDLEDEWENLRLAGEYLGGEMDGSVREWISQSYLQFNGQEGINTLSMLFCKYKSGGTITALDSGQNSWKSRERAIEILDNYLQLGMYYDNDYIVEEALSYLGVNSPYALSLYTSKEGNDYNRYDYYILGWTEYYREVYDSQVDPRYIKAQCYVESRMGFSSNRNEVPTDNTERDVMQCLDVRNYNIYDYIGIDVRKYYVITSENIYYTGEKMWGINLGKKGYPPPLAGVYNSEKYGRCGGIVRLLFTTEKNGGGEYYYEGSDKEYYFHLDGVNPMMSIAIGVDTMHQNLEKSGGNQQKALYLYNKDGDLEYISKVEAIVNAEGSYQGE